MQILLIAKIFLHYSICFDYIFYNEDKYEIITYIYNKFTLFCLTQYYFDLIKKRKIEECITQKMK